MHRSDKEHAVAELTEQLQRTESLIVADYRGLTNVQLGQLRGRLREHGATLTVVKNTLARRAAEASGTTTLLELLSGPTAIAFVSTEGDPVAVAKALADTAKETKILTFRGGLLEGAQIDGGAVEELAKLPPLDILKGQVVGAIIAPLNQLLGLVTAPLQNLVGLIDSRIDQLQASGAVEPVPEPAAEATPAEEAVEASDGEAAAAAAPAVDATIEDAEAETSDSVEPAGEADPTDPEEAK
ncbi:MAG: 50S ribosomal protein L10 [Gaiella sp.]